MKQNNTTKRSATMLRSLTLGALAATTMMAGNKQPPIQWHHGKVMWQRVGTEDLGATSDVVPIFTDLHSQTVRIIVKTNVISIEADGFRWTWMETGHHLPRVRDRLVLAVPGPVDFYADKNRFVILDKLGKKHWFEPLAQEVIGAGDPANNVANAGAQIR